MMSVVGLVPGSAGCVIYVGQDRVGHWLVQESRGRLEGRFVSREAAIAFARSERHSFDRAEIVMATQPLVPIVPFDPVDRDGLLPAKAA